MRQTAGQQHRASIASRTYRNDHNDCWGKTSTPTQRDPIVQEVLDETRFERGLIADASKYRAQRDELLAALQALASTARTFRNVPQEDQEWTSIDEDALTAAFAAIAKATQTNP